MLDHEKQELDSTAQSMRQAVRFLRVLWHRRMTCSIGVATFGSTQDTPDLLLRQADIAMYRAKAAGGHAVEFVGWGVENDVLAKRTFGKPGRCTAAILCKPAPYLQRWAAALSAPGSPEA